MKKRSAVSCTMEFIFWALIAAAVGLSLGVTVAKAGVLMECETDSECEQALNESLRVIDQSTIPESLKWYCNEYPQRELGGDVYARTYTGKPIEIESCEQVVVPQYMQDVV